ncbi:MAG: hypothetical protein HY894_03130 [Deltaproteobacteria bacterium]|nr:hypothetical protein [Deltaproteobacteria bacterium]
MRFIVAPDGEVDENFLKTKEEVADARRRLGAAMKEANEKNEEARRKAWQRAATKLLD